MKHCSVILLVCYALAGHTQAPAEALHKVLQAVDSARAKLPGEKIYLQFDKNNYIIGDTSWFKAYLFNASYLTSTSQSGVLYIDITDDTNRLVKQYRFQVTGGVAWGNINFNKEDFKEGRYTLRAYTNWIKNFCAEHFFFHRFALAGSTENNVLVNMQTQVFTANDKDSLRAALKFLDFSGQPLSNRQLTMSVLSGRQNLFQGNVVTTGEGRANVSFTWAASRKLPQLTLIALDKANNQKTNIPLQLNRQENMDLQFLPEGGYLVAGLPAHVGFKAIGEDGLGTNVQGVIVNSTRQQAAVFKSTYKGMGCFNFTPAPNESYSAIVTGSNGNQLIFPLPPVKQTGIVLHVENNTASDSIEVMLYVSPGFTDSISSLLLIGKAREVLCYASALSFNSKTVIKKQIPKNKFPQGVAQFSVLQNFTPLCQRLSFISTKDSTEFDISTDKAIYNTRDSISLALTFRSANAGIAGDFSVAVTDDAVTGNDSAGQNILTYTLLSSDLKGYIEEPNYYFNQKDTMAAQALDNLLLTQGWAGYSWEAIFRPGKVVYEAEPGFTVKGTITNFLNKRISHAKINLLSTRPPIIMDTLTDERGRFVFTDFPVIDTPVFFIQAKNKQGKNLGAGIYPDTLQVPPFTSPSQPAIQPWYINTDSTLLNQVHVKEEIDKRLLEGLTLAPVTVTAKKRVDESSNLNGSGNADIVFDKNDLTNAGSKSLLTLLKEKVPGFHEGLFPPVSITHDIRYSKPNWMVYDKAVSLVIDGTNIDAIFVPFDGPADIEPRNYYEQYLQTYLDYYTAADVKGIEVIYSPKYNFKYNVRFHQDANPVTSDWVYIEITTWGKKGPFTRITPGTIVYRTIPLSMPAKFYSPRYGVKDTSDHSADLRSTIFWEPNVITDSTGTATVSFYAADRPTTYTIIAEGTDFNGNLATKTKKIFITPRK